jgi:hypothetical protein
MSFPKIAHTPYNYSYLLIIKAFMNMKSAVYKILCDFYYDL